MKFKDKLMSLNPVIAVLLAFVVSGVVVFISGGQPFEAYQALAKGAFGSTSGIVNTIRYTIPIIMLGLSFAVCSKCGYFNIGQEGQMYAAALSIAAVQAWIPNVSPVIRFVLMVVAAIVAGGLMCFIPAILKFAFGANEIIIAMLLNYIAVLFSNYMLLYSSFAEKGKTTPLSIRISPEIPGIALIIVAIVIIVIYYIATEHSVFGYNVKMIGLNSTFSKVSGLNITKTILTVSFLGGAFSAISAAGEIFGVYNIVYNGFAENLGFYGMTAALIGRGSTVGLVLGAVVLGALQSGSVSLSVTTDVPSEMVLVVQGFVMLFATVNILQYFSKKNAERE